MEENNQQNDTSTQPENTPPPAPIPPTKTPQNEETPNHSNSRIAQIIEWLNRHNKIVHLAINFLLMMGTFLLFWKAMDQSTSAERAAKAAENTVDQVRKQFEIENSPILSISPTIGLSNFKTIRDRPIITIRIQNFSKLVIRVDSAVLGFRFDTSHNLSPYVEGDTNITQNHRIAYITPEHSFLEEKFDSREKIYAERFGKIEDGFNIIYGIIYYNNYISKNEGHYFFSVTVNTQHPSPDTEANQYWISNIYVSENSDTLKKGWENIKSWSTYTAAPDDKK